MHTLPEPISARQPLFQAFRLPVVLCSLLIVAAFAAGCAGDRKTAPTAAAESDAGFELPLRGADSGATDLQQGSLLVFVKTDGQKNGAPGPSLTLQFTGIANKEPLALPDDFLEVTIDSQPHRLPAIPTPAVTSPNTPFGQSYQITPRQLQLLAHATDARIRIPGAAIVQQRLNQRQLDYFKRFAASNP